MCDQCVALMINGVYCHEHGCPDAWKTKKHECKWCGSSFKPEHGSQMFCSDECCKDYN